MLAPVRFAAALAIASTAFNSAGRAQAPVAPPPVGLVPGNAPVQLSGSVPVMSEGALQLITLDGQFSQSVAKGGGAAFATWFADDAVTLSNGKNPVLGKSGILLSAHWKPSEYTLQWIPLGAQMSEAADMGFTWGHYDATTFHPGGNPTVQGGRYITIWKKQPDGKWKVALDASADEPRP